MLVLERIRLQQMHHVKRYIFFEFKVNLFPAILIKYITLTANKRKFKY